MKRFLKVLFLLILLISCGTGLLFWLLIQVPEDYQQRINIAPAVRAEKLANLKTKTEQLVQEIKSEPVWTFELTEEEANSWLSSTQFEQEIGKLLPSEVSEPRVKLRKDSIQLSFQITHEEWSGVITTQLKVIELAKKKMTIQVVSLKAGVLPVSLKDLFTGMLDEEQIPLNISWNQTETADLITLQLPEETQFQGEVESVQMQNGQVIITGGQSPLEEKPGE